MYKNVAPALFLAALVVVAICYVLAGAKIAFFVVMALILLAWLLVMFLSIRDPEDARPVASLLESFHHRVDRLKQDLGTDAKAIDDHVAAAFDQLHAQLVSLLKQRKIKFAQVKREVLKFHDPNPPTGPRWRPPTLSEMGYVLAAADKFSPDTAVLALYKFSGEARTRDGTVADTYTILKEGASASFSAAFEAKIQSPHAVQLAATEATDVTTVALRATTAPAQDDPRRMADADHIVGYILSLLRLAARRRIQIMGDNLRAIALLPAAAPSGEVLPPEAVWSGLRGLLTEPVSRHSDCIAPARAALRQAPHLLVCAAAAIERDHWDYEQTLLSSLTTFAEIVVPADKAAHAACVDVMRSLALLIHSLETVPAQQLIANPGYAYVEARGAEADAGMLKRIAELILPADRDAQAYPVFVVTTLTPREFQVRLRDYRELNASADEQAVIDTLFAGLKTMTLTLQTVVDQHALKEQEILKATHDRKLVLCADPTLVDVQDIHAGTEYLLWTLSGRTLRVSGPNLLSLRSAAQAIRAYANARLPASTSA